MPEPKRKALLRALCLAAAGSALFASLYVGSTSAYFTDTATVQVETITAASEFKNQNTAGQSDPEGDTPAVVDEADTADADTVEPTPEATEQPAPEASATPTPTPEVSATPTPTPAAEPTATPAPSAEPAPEASAEPPQQPTPEPAAEPTPEPAVTTEPETATAPQDAGTLADPVSFAAPIRTAHRAPQKQTTLELYRGNVQAAQAFDLPNMLPGDTGDTAEKEYTVNVSHRGTVTLYFSAAPRDAAAPLAGGLQLTVTCNGVQLYSGAFADVPAVLPVEIPGTAADTADAMTYRIAVALPTSAGNEYQSLTMTADLNWWVDEIAPTPAPTATPQPGTTPAPADTASGSAPGQLSRVPHDPATGKPNLIKALAALPQTADGFPLGVLVVLLAVSAAALACLLLAKRKGDNREHK